jgi:hypothetical protein
MHDAGDGEGGRGWDRSGENWNKSIENEEDRK